MRNNHDQGHCRKSVTPQFSDVAVHFAVSVAAAFNARLAGIAFIYEPIIPVMIDMYGIPPT